MESIHKGHRERLRQRFKGHGLDSFSDVEALEMLLFYALPRRNTNELAHYLLSSFGSFRAVMEARPEDLMRVDGIGENAALLIRLTAEFGRRYMLSGRRTGKPIRGSEEAGAYLMPLFSYETNEQVYLLCLDSAGMVKNCCRIAEGAVNMVDFSSRDVAEAAVRCGAVSVVLAHNHLSGTALPSSADISATKRLSSALALLGIELSDHIIVCGGDFVSLKDSGYL